MSTLERITGELHQQYVVTYDSSMNAGGTGQDRRPPPKRRRAWTESRAVMATRCAALVAMTITGVVLLSHPRIAAAECYGPDRVCEKINDPGPIVIAKALAPLDGAPGPSGSYMWRMRIERSYRGSLRGTVDLFVSSGDLTSPARLTTGESYLFYVRTHLPDGSDGLAAHVGCGVSLALHLATKEELAFLSRLGSRAADAYIFGEITSPGPADQSAIASGRVRVKATTARKIYTALVRPDGTFDISGLPPGTYRLSVQLPSGLRISDDGDPVVVQPHGCAERDLAP